MKTIISYKHSIVPPLGVRGLISLIGIITHQFFFAQGFIWGKKGGSNTIFSTTSARNTIRDLKVDNNNNYYAVGLIGHLNTNIDGNPKTYWGEPNSSYFLDTFIASFGCDGTYRWSKIFGGEGFEFLEALQIDTQNNVYISGTFGNCTQNTTFPPRIDNDFMISQTPSADCRVMTLVKYDANGTLQWVKRPQDSQTATSGIQSIIYKIEIDASGTLHCLALLPPGSYENGQLIVGGTTRKMYVMRYNSAGTFLGATAMDFNFTIGALYHFKFALNPYNNLYYIMGYRAEESDTYTTGGVTYSGLNMPFAYFAAYNQQGQLQWIRNEVNNHASMGGSYIYFQDFVLDGPDIYITANMIGGSWVTFLGYTNTNNIDFNQKSVVFKTNATASTLYWGTQSSSGNAYTERLVTKGDKVYLATSASNTLTWGTQSLFINTSNQSADVVLVELSKATGACTAINKIPGNPYYLDMPTAAIKDNNNDIVLGGYFEGQLTFTNNTLSQVGGRENFFITKFSNNVCSLSTEEQNLQEVKLYPNPVQNTLNLTTQEDITNWQILNLQGQIVLQGNKPLENNINVSILKSSMYILQLDTSKGIVREKFLKEAP